MDIVTVGDGEGNISWWENHGKGKSFSRHIIITGLKVPRRAKSGDFDNDGHMELAVTAYI
jgi:FG-GAP-like repeat